MYSLISENISEELKEILSLSDVQYGIADEFLLKKAHKDKNGIYANCKIIRERYSSMKDILLKLIKIGSVIVVFRQVSDDYHFTLERVISKEKATQYALLL